MSDSTISNSDQFNLLKTSASWSKPTEAYKLTLGPCLFNWKVNDWRDFYYNIAENSEVDEVYIGEVVCQKRYPFFEVAMNDVVDRLISCGKRVHFSTFSLILGELEMSICKKLIEQTTQEASGLTKQSSMIEVNDVGLLGLFGDHPYIIGPTINVYNEDTVETLRKQGAQRFCFPYEIDKESLNIMAQNPYIEKEVFAFGRMPLAIAARCYHARIHGTTKDDCRYVCEKDYNGKAITTLTDENFLTVNGTQTMSFTYVNLINELQDLLSMGVNIFRISPHFMDIVGILALFKQVLDKKIDSKEGFIKINALMPLQSKFSNGFYYGEAGRNLKGQGE
ncbi:U32 family peptidase [Candidatus Hepatincolaceae symbiont of Richtersius coronifer]